MTAEIKAHIFEPFFTTKKQGKGTGLGLATVFGIVKQSEGHIAVHSEVGVGTVFKILLPAYRETVAVPSKDEPAAKPGSETVLVVEDEEQVRKLARIALETQGYRVVEASNGKEAIEVTQAHQGPIHFVLTDVVMPEMSGRQMAEYFRQHHPALTVLFMGGYTDDAGVRHGIIDAKDDFLQKPFSPLALARKVREVLDKKYVVYLSLKDPPRRVVSERNCCCNPAPSRLS